MLPEKQHIQIVLFTSKKEKKKQSTGGFPFKNKTKVIAQ